MIHSTRPRDPSSEQTETVRPHERNAPRETFEAEPGTVRASALAASHERRQAAVGDLPGGQTCAKRTRKPARGGITPLHFSKRAKASLNLPQQHACTSHGVPAGITAGLTTLHGSALECEAFETLRGWRGELDTCAPGGMLARAICPPTIDGGTRLVYWMPEADEWSEPDEHGEVHRKAANTRREAATIIPDRSGINGRRPFVVRPLPRMAQLQRGFAAILRAVRAAAMRGDLRARDFDLPTYQLALPGIGSMAAPRGRVTCKGKDLSTFVVYVEGGIYLELSLRDGRVLLQAKAQHLWMFGASSEGWLHWWSMWGPLVHWWLQGVIVPARGLHDCGWNVSGVELCQDYVGLSWSREDLKDSRWVGGKESTFGHQREPGFVEEAKQRARVMDEPVYTFGGSAIIETWGVGSRKSPFSLCCYHKDQQLRATGVDGSKYAPVHEAHGWDGEADRTRVEMRITKQALVIERAAFDDVVADAGIPSELLERLDGLDMRDPMTLCDPVTLRAVWWYFGSKYRLCHQTYTASGRPEKSTRLPMDERWAAVVEAGSHMEPNAEWARMWRQDRAVQRRTFEARQRSAYLRQWRATMEIGAARGLSFGACIDQAPDLMGLSLERLTDEELSDLSDHHRRHGRALDLYHHEEKAEASAEYQTERTAAYANYAAIYETNIGPAATGPAKDGRHRLGMDPATWVALRREPSLARLALVRELDGRRLAPESVRPVGAAPPDAAGDDDCGGRPARTAAVRVRGRAPTQESEGRCCGVMDTERSNTGKCTLVFGLRFEASKAGGCCGFEGGDLRRSPRLRSSCAAQEERTPEYLFWVSMAAETPERMPTNTSPSGRSTMLPEPSGCWTASGLHYV